MVAVPGIRQCGKAYPMSVWRRDAACACGWSATVLVLIATGCGNKMAASESKLVAAGMPRSTELLSAVQGMDLGDEARGEFAEVLQLWACDSMRIRVLGRLIESAHPEPSSRILVLVESGGGFAADYSATVVLDDHGTGTLYYAGAYYSGDAEKSIHEPVERYDVPGKYLAFLRRAVGQGSFEGGAELGTVDGDVDFVSTWHRGQRTTVAFLAVPAVFWDLDLDRPDEELPDRFSELSALVSRVAALYARLSSSAK